MKTRRKRIALIALVLVAALAGLTAVRSAMRRTTHPRVHGLPAAANARKGDVSRSEDGRLFYFDGQRWTDTPPTAQDTPF